MRRSSSTKIATRHPDVPPASSPGPSDRDITRVEGNQRARLHALGVTVDESDGPLDIVRMLDAIERFEVTVRSAGGDLMMDEPPPGSTPQPDAPGRDLPARKHGEWSEAYSKRIDAAAGRL